MKRFFVMLCLIASIKVYSREQVFGRKLCPLEDTTILPQILGLPLGSYIGKPVDSLLIILPIGSNHLGCIPARLGYVKGVYQTYGNNSGNHVSIQIFFDSIQHHPKPHYSPCTGWNMSLLKKETISYIKVVRNNIICLFGCDNPRYY